MEKYKRSKEELLTALAEQRGFLRSSSQGYDDGVEVEAKRLAAIAYILLHDGKGRTKSLLGQLHFKNTLKFLSTVNPAAGVNENGKSIMCPTTALAAPVVLPNGHAAFLPPCNHTEKPRNLKYLNFKKWWNETIFTSIKPNDIIRQFELKDQTMSRKDLVLHLRDQDGGSHVDEELEKNPYLHLAIYKQIGMYRKLPDGRTVPFEENPHLASMRQIGWEIEQTLKELPDGPALPPFEGFPPKRYRSLLQDQWDPETLTVIPPTLKEIRGHNT